MFRRFWWIFFVMLPVGAIGGLLVMAVVTYVMPKKYESETVIEVRPMTSPSEVGVEPPQTTPQYFFGTEFNKIKSRASLAEVVEKLELINQWGVDQEHRHSDFKGDRDDGKYPGNGSDRHPGAPH